MQRLMMLLTTSGACLGLLAVATVAVAGANPAQRDTHSLLPTHRRQKRDWIWNQMHIDEEKNTSLPHHVGKVRLKPQDRRRDARSDTTPLGAPFQEREKQLIAVLGFSPWPQPSTPPSFPQEVHKPPDLFDPFKFDLAGQQPQGSLSAGTSVISVTAVDADDPTVGDHASVMYQILKGKEYFAIDNSGRIVTITKSLDREKQARYEIVVEARDAQGLRGDSGTATVLVTLQDINDNFPFFTQTKYTFVVPEDTRVGTSVGSLFVEDPDEPQNRMTKYSILRGDYQDAFTIETNPTHNEGIIKPAKPLDYEYIQQYSFIVEATDPTIDLRYMSPPAGNRAQVIINITDVDEPPIFQQPFYHFQLKENQKKPLIDKDITPRNVKFKFTLNTENNFTLTDNHDNTANITVKYGQFDREHTKVHFLPVVISDNGMPSRTGTSTLTVAVCKCNEQGEFTFCEDMAAQVGVSIQAVVAILLCILTITVITLLIFLRRRLRKQAHAHGKSVPEIHEQLVTYDEEGGGEMDTTSYDVSVLNSVRHGGAKPLRPALDARPSLYAQVQKPPRHAPGAHGGPGEMAAMIEVKKDEADHDGDGPPYDTLHIYGYEGSESIAESLSSLGTDSSDSDVDYDFLNDWGPRFKMLAELYGSDPREELLY
uniref:Cadherin-5 n=1 Tax=Nomascus leucogenys TaxID=61853 RepID=A0A2I3HI79_NOMLE